MSHFTVAFTMRKGRNNLPAALCTGAAVQLTSELAGDRLEVHEVAEASACALSHLVLTAARLSATSNQRARVTSKEQ